MSVSARPSGQQSDAVAGGYGLFATVSACGGETAGPSLGVLAAGRTALGSLPVTSTVPRPMQLSPSHGPISLVLRAARRAERALLAARSAPALDGTVPWRQERGLAPRGTPSRRRRRPLDERRAGPRPPHRHWPSADAACRWGRRAVTGHVNPLSAPARGRPPRHGCGHGAWPGKERRQPPQGPKATRPTCPKRHPD